MNTVTDKVNDIMVNTAEIRKQYPEVSNVWWDFYDCPLEEIFELGETFKCKPEYMPENQYLRLHLTGLGPNVTCFVRSVKVKPRVQFPIDKAYFEEV